MKRIITNTIIILLLSFPGLSNYSNAQALFKDLNPGTNGSNPDQYMNVNGTMYFITNTTPSYVHQLWKSDGTEENTVMVKDSIITTNVVGIITFINLNDTLYYMLNKNGSSTSATITELWKTDGTTEGTVLITTLTNANPSGGSGDYPPQHYTVAGNKIFFQMGKGHGMELWVSDGTSAGTMEVIDLNPGNSGSYFYGGVANAPMIAYKGLVYFQGGTTLGASDFYSSDGTPGGTTVVKSIPGFNPKFFIIYNDTIYFQAYSSGNDGIWKSDGTTPGTENVTSTGFNNNAKIFKNAMYYSSGGTLWKSNGTASGTMAVMDSAGAVTGMNSNYFYTSYLKSLSVPPYYTYYYWQSDGTPGGTVRISKQVGKAASFNLLNDKMYNSVADSVGYTSGLWETDGTDGGTSNLLTGYLSYPFIFNTTVFFSNFVSSSGYELWSLTPLSVGIFNPQADQAGFNIYPNPSSGIFNIEWNRNKNASLKVFNMLGEEILQQVMSTQIDLSNTPKGIYFATIYDGEKYYNQKIVVQ